MPPRIIAVPTAPPPVPAAVERANQVLHMPEFYAGISQRKKFKDTKVAPATIARLIQDCDLEFRVDTFEPGPEHDRTLGLFNHKFPDKLALNRQKLVNGSGWSRLHFVEDVAATIIHECVHAVDQLYTQYRFGHRHRKRGTAPYWIGNHAFHLLIDDSALELAFDRISDIGTEIA